MRRLPLTALWAFEAAARHQNLTAAAAEMNLTHAAVSRHIRELETYFGRPLFERLPRGLRTTADGQRLAGSCTDAFTRLYEGVEAMRIAAHPAITLTTLPSLAAHWLIPRMSRFQEHFPDVEWRLDTRTRLVDFMREPVDIGIRFGPGSWPGLYSQQLFRPGEFAVCAPALRDGAKPIRKPEDLLQHTLLHGDSNQDWATWFSRAGLNPSQAQRGPVFTDSNVLVQAAVAGQGIALVPEPLAWADLMSGRLLKLFDITIEPTWSYFVVCRQDRRNEPLLVALIEWLQEEARATSADLLCQL